MSNREYASLLKITQNGEELLLNLKCIGEGTSCVAYRVETEGSEFDGVVVKEFYPEINGIPMMYRLGTNEKLEINHNLRTGEKTAIQERRSAFLQGEKKIISFLADRDKKKKQNTFLVPTIRTTSNLGEVQWCSCLWGDNLEMIFSDHQGNSFRERLKYVLPYIIWIFEELEVYHDDPEHGLKEGQKTLRCLDNVVLHLDIKPENLLAIKSRKDGDYIAIRNLDFGSAKIASQLIESICKYANNSVSKDEGTLKNEIISKFFFSSMPYYDAGRVERIVDDIIKHRNEKEDQISNLRQLDIIAALKTFLFAMADMDSHHNWVRTQETDFCFNLLDKLFQTNTFLKTSSLFAHYDVYIRLREIFERSFGDDIELRLDANEISCRLKDILNILLGTEQRNVHVAMNNIYSTKDSLLNAHNLFSISDIIEFCQKHKIDYFELKDIQYFLLVGKKHE